MSVRNAMILGAGLGERMEHLTKDRPKPLVKVRQKPLIDHVLGRLEEIEIDKVVVNVHYKADLLEKHLAHRRAPKIVISDERKELLDTGGGITKALSNFGQKPFLVHNSDSIWIEGAGSSLRRLTKRWDSKLMDGLLLLASTTTSIGYSGQGDFIMDPDGRLSRRPEREIAPYVYAGVSILHPRLFKDRKVTRFSLNEVWNQALEANRLYGLRHEGVWMHIGSPDAVSDAEAYVEEIS